MPLVPLLWALFAVPGWLLVAGLPAALVGEGGPLGPMLVVGFVTATGLAYGLDRRLGPPGPPRYGMPDRPLWLLWAVVAGLGFTVLGSELGNVGAQIAGVPLRDPEVPEAPLLLAPWDVLVPLTLRLGLFAVAVGISERGLLALHRPWVAIVLTAFIGAVVMPSHMWLQAGLLLGFPAWLFCHTRSLGLALAGYLPPVLVSLLPVLGVELGIQGFDTFEHGPKPFQPIWFDLLGAALVAAGVGPLLGAFDREARADAPPDPPGPAE